MSEVSPSLLRHQIFRSGLTGAMFEHIANSDAISFQDIFGDQSLLIVEFDVLLLGEHSHLVYVGSGENLPEIITSYPDQGTLRVAPPMPWVGSRHSPSAKGGRHRVAIIQPKFSRQEWGEICLNAQRLDDARLNYHFIRQNSNSVAATLRASAGLRYTELRGGGFNFGARNLLHDELAGGPQSRRLLFRGGTSYLGHGPVRASVGDASPELLHQVGR